MEKYEEDLLVELEEIDISTLLDKRIYSDNDVEAEYANLSFRIVYQSYNYFVPQIEDMIKNKEVWNLRPEYQRRLRWTPKQKSLLIESLLLNIPIPPIFLYESELARYEVMDGQQRLNAIYEFITNGFKLIGLEKLHFINGRSYNNLPPKLKRGLDRSSLSAIVLLQETKADKNDPYLVRRYVFERLNTGGQKLNPQEIRNCIYKSEFNDLIVALARNNDFCSAFGIPRYTETDENEFYENPQRQKNQLYKTMGDCQIVLRFFAFMEDTNIIGSIKSILDRCMDNNKEMSVENAKELELAFNQCIELSVNIFGSRPFDLPESNRASIGLYDAIMGALWRRLSSANLMLQHRDVIVEKISQLATENKELMTGKASTSQSIKDRILAVLSIFDEVCRS